VEVILLESIQSLGRKGEVVKVRNGFGRNYLIPQRKAMPVNADTLHRLKTLKRKFEIEEAQLVSELREVADRLEGVELNVVAKATPEGHLFGSVTPQMLAIELESAHGHKFLDRAIRLGEPIKSVGKYTVAVRLHPDVEAQVTLVVDAEGGLRREPEAEEAPEEGAPAAEGAQEAEGAAPTDAANSSEAAGSP
jgi:large subunit ribosomal protein L9